MRLSIKIAFCLAVANLALMTGPGMVIYGLGGAPLTPWLPPLADAFDLSLSGAAGLVWPVGLPLVVRAFDPLKRRVPWSLHCVAVCAALYLWAVIVAGAVHLGLGVPAP